MTVTVGAGDGTTSGTSMRLGRLFDRNSGRAVILAFDHGLSVGIRNGGEDSRRAVAALVAAEPDGVLLSPGLLRAHADLFAFRGSPSVVARLDFAVVGERASGRTEEYRPLWQVDAVAAMGADAVACFLILGFEDNSRFADNVAAVATAARAAHEHGLPLIVETVPWGATATPSLDLEELRFGCRLAVELGADVVKTVYPGVVDAMAAVVGDCGVPVMVLGGASEGGSIATELEEAIDGGARGAIYGRRVWQSQDIGVATHELMAVAHGAR
jgi:DhnA family fructose-bisphosphate aldolase class Ia